MIDKKESSTGSSETFITGSAESINDTIEKISNGVNEIRTENITLVNHRHQHFYGDPNAKLNNISDDNDTLATITKITLGGIAIFGGIKLISSGGNDIKRIEEEKQKAIEMKENKEIKIIALNNEDKYSWYNYDNKTLKESNDIKTDKQYLFSIYTNKGIITLFNKMNPINSKFGNNDIIINNPLNNIIYKIFKERISNRNFKTFFYIEENINKYGSHYSHFERESDEIKIKRIQYKVTEINDENIKLKFIKIN